MAYHRLPKHRLTADGDIFQKHNALAYVSTTSQFHLVIIHRWCFWCVTTYKTRRLVRRLAQLCYSSCTEYIEDSFFEVCEIISTPIPSRRVEAYRAYSCLIWTSEQAVELFQLVHIPLCSRSCCNGTNWVVEILPRKEIHIKIMFRILLRALFENVCSSFNHFTWTFQNTMRAAVKYMHWVNGKSGHLPLLRAID